jgi:hypothetical protein
MRSYKNLGATYFFALADPFPVVLRELSAAYLERAHQRLRRALDDAGQRQADWRFGWIHPGYGSVPAYDRILEGSPITYIGWISVEATDDPEWPSEEGRFARIGRDLRAGAPALLWGATSSRAYGFEATPGDHDAWMAELCELMDEPMDWAPAELRRMAPAPDEPLHRVARAFEAGDGVAYRAAMAAAAEAYSPDGLRLLRAGLALVDPTLYDCPPLCG